jgi:hypothetical protein
VREKESRKSDALLLLQRGKGSWQEQRCAVGIGCGCGWVSCWQPGKERKSESGQLPTHRRASGAASNHQSSCTGRLVSSQKCSFLTHVPMHVAPFSDSTNILCQRVLLRKTLGMVRDSQGAVANSPVMSDTTRNGWRQQRSPRREMHLNQRVRIVITIVH